MNELAREFVEDTMSAICTSKHVRALLLAILTVGLMGSRLVAQGSDDRARRFEAPFCKLSFGRGLIKVQSDRRLIGSEYSVIPKYTQSLLDRGYAIRLERKANPYMTGEYNSPPNASIRVFAASPEKEDDLIDLSWVFLGQHLRMVSSINAMRLEINLDEAGENRSLDQFGRERRDRVRGLVGAIFRLRGENTYGERYEIDLRWPNTLEDGVTFSSNPERSIRTLMRWHQRLDAFVDDGVLSILSYKHIPQMMMYRDGAKWFPDDFRVRVHMAQRMGIKIEPRGAKTNP